MSKEEMLAKALKGKVSEWSHVDGTKVTNENNFSCWNHKIEYGVTQEEADTKLYTYYKDRGLLE